MNIFRKLTTIVFCIAVLCLYSCESCLECTLEYTDAQTNRDTTIVRTQCSKKKDREQFESDTKERAIENNGTYNCIVKEN